MADLLSVWGRASVTFAASPSGCQTVSLLEWQHLTFLVQAQDHRLLCVPAGCLVQNFSVEIGQ